MKINMQNKVKSTLIKYKNSRDCDPYLLYFIWESELKDINYDYSLNIDNIPLGSETRKHYERNKKLIDLSQIPEHIEKNIINTYKDYKVKDRSLLLNYFMKHKLKSLIENINDF